MLPKLYFVIPCYNEEEALPLTAPVFRKKIADLTGKIDPASRIVLVDDGSKDSTWEIISSLHAGDSTFTGLRLDRNRGHQNALTAGLMWARDKCDITISIDADLQDDIDAVDAMVEKYKEGCGVVCGVRASRETDTFLKRFTARSYYAFMRALNPDIIFDHADYRLMDKKALEALAHYQGDDLFLRGLVNRLGAQVGTVTYDRRAREAGESKYTIKKMVKLAMKGIASGKAQPAYFTRDVKYIAEILHS